MVGFIHIGIGPHFFILAYQVGFTGFPHTGTFFHNLVDRVDGNLNGNYTYDAAILPDWSSQELSGGVVRRGIRFGVG